MDLWSNPEVSHVFSYRSLMREKRHGEINDDDLQLQNRITFPNSASATHASTNGIQRIYRLVEHHRIQKLFNELEKDHQLLATVRGQLADAYQQVMTDQS